MRQIYILLLFILFGLPSQAQVFPFRNLVSFTLSANEENNCMFFDKEGMLWVGTNSGVKSYDGYTVKTYKSDIYSPGILPNNTVRSITEDHDNNLWLGTRNGLVRMNKRTGSFNTFLLIPFSPPRMARYGLVPMVVCLISTLRMRPSIHLIIRTHGL